MFLKEAESMNFPRGRNPVKPRNHRAERSAPESTGSEAEYLRSLVDSRSTVTVFLKTGERLRGRIRYYDRDCFSIGLSNGPNIFLRNHSVLYVSES